MMGAHLLPRMNDLLLKSQSLENPCGASSQHYITNRHGDLEEAPPPSPHGAPSLLQHTDQSLLAFTLHIKNS
jgi:hypothetical protein